METEKTKKEGRNGGQVNWRLGEEEEEGKEEGAVAWASM
jgi:hypothetical protein